ncbi:MAG: twin-arginine translocation signal domain-containing protein, partial [Muribaculaceae bacterium]|nr:twin-arginine translocation signal domain-containing protein [Muribaculaceae bacterium]
MNRNNIDDKRFSRRDFLKTLGLAGIASAGISSCLDNGKKNVVPASGEEPSKDSMTYRVTP